MTQRKILKQNERTLFSSLNQTTFNAVTKPARLVSDADVSFDVKTRTIILKDQGDLLEYLPPIEHEEKQIVQCE